MTERADEMCDDSLLFVLNVFVIFVSIYLHAIFFFFYFTFFYSFIHVSGPAIPSDDVGPALNHVIVFLS